MSLIEEYLNLRDKWSKAFEEQDEELFESLTEKGKQMREKFTKKDWEILIEKTDNKQAKDFYKKQMEKAKNS